MNFLKPILVFVVFVSLGNCAELFSSKEKDNNDVILAALLANSGTCGQSARSGAAGNGTRFNFFGCSGDATTTLLGLGFTAQNVTFNGGISGTSDASTIVTRASSLSSSGGSKKAGIEVTYVLNNASSTLKAILPGETNFNGPGFLISATTIQKLVDNTSSAFTKSATWGTSLGIEKTLCLEVHEESGAHIFGWEGSCDSVNRSSYQFEQDSVTVNVNGDRVGLRLNNVIVKSMTIYSSVIGTSGMIR
ncbi:hypothetical protein [Leptospira paudalimensis]|uniref:Lipoprotein n=1 Tax=Leptospira paudalimensis TaxID=2950024 RepID=A0ABT3M826_9LEPT|nr:hypothetical protein [Leptospira paudalimensis]MCW7504543.1 hypothetical protein [Leptospira paudalimensis]